MFACPCKSAPASQVAQCRVMCNVKIGGKKKISATVDTLGCGSYHDCLKLAG